MTCNHKINDPSCSDYQRGFQDGKENKILEIYSNPAYMDNYLSGYKEGQKIKSYDSSNYEIIDVEVIENYLIAKVQYSYCPNCEFEGVKIMIFANISLKDVIKWKVIDPHFRRPQKVRKIAEAPTPIARFPGSSDGWQNAIALANLLVTNERNNK